MSIKIVACMCIDCNHMWMCEGKCKDSICRKCRFKGVVVKW